MAVVVVVTMVVFAVTMIVIAVAVVLLGDHLVALEQAHAQQQRQGNLAVDRPEDAGVGLDGAQLALEGLKPGLVDQVAFVQQQHVAVDDLGPGHLAVEHCVAEVLGVHQGDDGVEPRAVAQVAAQKGHRHRQRVSQAGCLNDQVIDRFRSVQDPVDRIQQFTVDRAADAPVAQFNGVLSSGNDQIVVNADLAKFIDKNGSFEPLLIAENVVEKGGLSSSKKTGQDRHRQRSAGVDRVQCCVWRGGGRGHGLPCDQARSV